MGYLISKDGSRIVGTFEVLHGCADFSDVTMTPDGKFEIEHSGGTEIYWNSQRTVTNENDLRLFVDEDGDVYSEADCTFVPEDTDD